MTLLLEQGTRVRSAVVASMLVGALVAAAAPAPASAAPTTMAGSAAATQIDVLNGTVASGPTSQSFLQTNDVGKSSSNRLASVDVAGLVSATTLSTQVSSSAIPGGKRVTSTSKAAGVALLGGVIKVDAITTTSQVSEVNEIASYTGDTEILGLQVGDQRLPIRVAPNTKITVPGLAEVVINKVDGHNTSDSTATVSSTGIQVTLLKAVQNAPAGAVIVVTPTSATIASASPAEGPSLGGVGHVVKASVRVGRLVTVLAGPVAAQYLPNGGTAGRELSTSTAAVNLPPIVRASVAGTTVEGSRTTTESSGTITAHVAHVNLFRGAIIADVVKASAHASRVSDDVPPTVSGSTTLLGLTIGGKAMPANPPPNTAIKVANLGTVTLNQQVRTSNGIRVLALDVVVSTAGLGVPLGAEVEVSTAYVTVGR